jgi:hypothetical protein
MKYTFSFKMISMAVTGLVVLTFCAQARSGISRSAYNKMLDLANSMQEQADREGLSSAYGNKLSNNLSRFESALNRAIVFSDGEVSSDDIGTDLLIAVEVVAADTGAIHKFPADAQQNIVDALDGVLSRLADDDGRIDDISFILDTLDGQDESVGALINSVRKKPRHPKRKKLAYERTFEAYRPNRRHGERYGRDGVDSNDRLARIRQIHQESRKNRNSTALMDTKAPSEKKGVLDKVRNSVKGLLGKSDTKKSEDSSESGARSFRSFAHSGNKFNQLAGKVENVTRVPFLSASESIAKYGRPPIMAVEEDPEPSVGGVS